MDESKALLQLAVKVVNERFGEICLDDTLEQLTQIESILRSLEKNSVSSIEGAIGVIQYARSYAANTKEW